jgi:hypothetical protein
MRPGPPALPVRCQEATCVAPDVPSAAGVPARAPDPVRDPAPGVAERRLVRGAVAAIALLAAPVSAIAWAFAGPAAALSALIGLGLVLVLFGASAVVLVHVARAGARVPVSACWSVARRCGCRSTSPSCSPSAGVPWVHGRSLAAATAVAIAVTLAVELRLLARPTTVLDRRRGHPAVGARTRHTELTAVTNVLAAAEWGGEFEGVLDPINALFEFPASCSRPRAVRVDLSINRTIVIAWLMTASSRSSSHRDPRRPRSCRASSRPSSR